MKNPNGYGSVVKLSGNRRKPFCARKTAGWNDKGYPVYQIIGYYATRQEALIALAEYNRAPYDIDLSRLTLQELFDRWSEREFTKLSQSSIDAYNTAMKHAQKLCNVQYKSIKAYHMQAIIDRCGHGYATQRAIRSLFSRLDRYALELDIIDKRSSILISSQAVTPSTRRPFNSEEIHALWCVADQEWVDSVLFLLYTGFRVSEMLMLETANVDLNQMTVQGGLKTDAGKNRIVPIHPRIEPFVRQRMLAGRRYLFSQFNSKCMSKSMFYRHWSAVMELIGASHTPHECRHTFRSLLDSAGANKVCIDLLMGHSSKDIGERVYTHKTINELRQTICLLN